MNRVILPLLALGALALGIAFGVLQRGEPPAIEADDWATATVLTPPRALADFQLTDQHGAAFSPAQLRDRWTLLFMGFTNCGHICPMTMGKLDLIAEALDDRVDVAFVSVDPGRDTPAVIAEYVGAFDPRFVGASGAAEQLDQLAVGLSAPYLVDRSGGRYIVDHSSAIFLIDPAARFAALFSAPHDVAAMVNDLQRLTDPS